MRRSYFRFMGIYWSIPEDRFKKFRGDIEQLGHVPDPAAYGARELKSRPRGHDIPNVEPEKDGAFWSSRT